jgi:hypothetical protein
VQCNLRNYVCDCEESEAECFHRGSGHGALVHSMYVPQFHSGAERGRLGLMLMGSLGGCIHLFFEGYFAYNFRRMGSMQDLFGQLWKEYSLSDSRYLTQDAFVLCMESITAVRLLTLALPAIIVRVEC